jgi:hypothetical protein
MRLMIVVSFGVTLLRDTVPLARGCRYSTDINMSGAFFLFGRKNASLLLLSIEYHRLPRCTAAHGPKAPCPENIAVANA